MAELGEAFNTLKVQTKPFQNIDYFFTQRTLTEDMEYIDKHMNRLTKKVKSTYNFLALNIPTITTITNKNGDTIEKPIGFDIEIYGDTGYNYKGTISSFMGILPNFMVPLRGDKKLFINIVYNYSDSVDNSKVKRYVNFIDVPKRYQNKEIDDNNSNFSNDSEVDNDE